MSLPEYILLAISSLFVIIDPIATVPAFLAMTPNDTPSQRIRMARVACLVAAIILLIFATSGKLIFKFFGITIPAIQIAGSIVLLLVILLQQGKEFLIQQIPGQQLMLPAKDGRHPRCLSHIGPRTHHPRGTKGDMACADQPSCKKEIFDILTVEATKGMP